MEPTVEGVKYPRHPKVLMRFFDEREHAEQFLDGRIRARTLQHYIDYEDEHGNRGDRMEGIHSIAQAGQFEMSLAGADLTEDITRVTKAWTNTTRQHVVCFFGGYPADGMTLSKAAQVLTPHRDYANFGDYCVVVPRPTALMDRIDHAVRSGQIAGVCKLRGRLVEYYDPATFSGEFEEPGFHKPHDFGWQSEFRLLFDTNGSHPCPTVFDVGSVREHAVLLERKQDAAWPPEARVHMATEEPDAA